MGRLEKIELPPISYKSEDSPVKVQFKGLTKDDHPVLALTSLSTDSNGMENFINFRFKLIFVKF